MNGPWVLMYHRVCERRSETRCWFERGTAVTPQAFHDQLTWLGARYKIVPLEELHAPLPPGAQSRIALTFDDGYIDTLDVAAPICAAHGAVATCFASAGPAYGGPPLWVDAWYELVHAGVDRADWGRILEACGFRGPVDLSSCVRGAAKQWIATVGPSGRGSILPLLASALAFSQAANMHLDLAGLRRLQHCGWRIGGHGVNHLRLTECNESTMLEELRGSRRMLADLDKASPPLFAYPDGAWNQAVREAVATEGFALACTVEPRPWSHSDHPLSIPRVFCRGLDRVPARMLIPVGSEE